MSLILTINGPNTIWMLADRRLSSKGRTVKDDARKVMFLETRDGVAIIGYAGLGATAAGTEPSDWMSAVLRGRNYTISQSLWSLAQAAKAQLPRHLSFFARVYPRPSHHILATTFIDGEVGFFTIDLILTKNRQKFDFRYTRHVTERPSQAKNGTPRFGIGGSGALYLVKDRTWMRPLLHLVDAYETARISPRPVCDHLAALNFTVHSNLSDQTVGPRCVVAWRNRKGGVHKGGGGHQFYDGVALDPTSSSIPTIGNGMDISALIQIMMPHFMKSMDSAFSGGPAIELDKDEINADLARLPDKPDETLR